MKELTQLQYFRCVARLENITKAAQQLHLSQPNLSRAIKRLESDLGVPLFDRTRGRLRLNAYGAAYLEYVDKAFQMLDAGERHLAEMCATEAKPMIAVGSVMWHFLEDLISSFTESHPDMDVHFSYSQMDQQTLQGALWSGTLDLASSIELAYPPGILWQPVFSCPICALVSTSNPLSQRKVIRMEELRGEAFVCNNAGINRGLTEQLCREAGFEANIVFESNEGPFAGTWLEKSDHVAFISAYDTLSLQETGIRRPVRFVRLSDPEPMMTLGIARPDIPAEKPRKSDVCEMFYQYAVSFFQAQTQKIQSLWPTFF